MTAHQSVLPERMTTAKNAKHAKVSTTATTHLKRDPCLNPVTVRDSHASAAINKGAAKPKPNASIICPAQDVEARRILHSTNGGDQRAGKDDLPFVEPRKPGSVESHGSPRFSVAC